MVATLLKCLAIIFSLLLIQLDPVTYATTAASNSTLEVRNWPFLVDVSKPNRDLSDDPVIGTLACPALMRLSLRKEKYESALLQSIVIEESGKRVVWKMQLAPSLSWWDGSRANASSIVEFLNLRLADILKEASESQWQIPKYEVKSLGELDLSITWLETPRFGPYILSYAPVWKKNADTSWDYQCLGQYKIQGDHNGFKMSRLRGNGKYQNIVFTKDESLSQNFSHSDVIYTRFANQFIARSSKASEKSTCHQFVSLPLMSVVSWDIRNGAMKNPELRKAFTQAMARGELMRTGSRGLGMLVSAPIPRDHPGYDQSLLVRSFEAQNFTRVADKLKFQTAPVNPSSQQKYRITLKTGDSQNGFLEKILIDTSRVAGISLAFAYGSGSQQAKIDGTLMGIKIGWPRVDLRRNFGADSQLPSWESGETNLKQTLDAYSLSLTFERPNFKLLKEIHKALFDIEPMSILMQHQVCLEGQGTVALDLKQKIDGLDPDWFPKIVGAKSGV